MATIEQRPLPPLNSTAKTIGEADRAEITANATAVIDHYLNGAGSYWDEGTQKSLQNRLEDIDQFKNAVIASKQFADDPGKILDSVVDLINSTTDRVQRIMAEQTKDRIQVAPPNTNDAILLNPRLTDDPKAVGKAPPTGMSPMLSRGGGVATSSGANENVRYLSRRLAR
jgi:hypothetical protein